MENLKTHHKDTNLFDLSTYAIQSKQKLQLAEYRLCERNLDAKHDDHNDYWREMLLILQIEHNRKTKTWCESSLINTWETLHSIFKQMCYISITFANNTNRLIRSTQIILKRTVGFCIYELINKNGTWGTNSFWNPFQRFFNYRLGDIANTWLRTILNCYSENTDSGHN